MLFNYGAKTVKSAHDRVNLQQKIDQEDNTVSVVGSNFNDYM